jgi:hypothetical protein
MSKWNESALRARLRADLALGGAGAAAAAAADRPQTAAAAARRLEFHRIVSGIDAGTISPDAAVALFDDLALVAA